MILITGASSGIGRACAEIFAQHSNDLLLVARRIDRLKRIQKELEEKYSVRVYVAKVDVALAKSCQIFFKTHRKLLPHVSLLINNAGLASGFELFQDSKISDAEQMIDVNLKGLLRFTHSILPVFLKKNHGHIINLGSVAGHYTYVKGNVYNASKYAVRAFTEALRLDLNGTAIRVTEISPGMVQTEFSEVRFGGDQKKAKAVYAGMKPLTAEDIAECIFWASNRPAHVNIQEMVVYPTDQASPHVVHRKF